MISRICIILFMTFICSCDSNDCLTYKQYDYKQGPDILIVSRIDSNKQCEYNVSLELRLCDTIYVEKAIMYLNKDKFYMRTITPKSKDFVLFDLKLNVGDKYEIKIDYKADNLIGQQTFKEILENKLISNNKMVYIFRIKDYYVYNIEDNKDYFDLVSFVTKENGVIGTYLSSFHNSIEYIVRPRGDILEEKIDYSKKRKVHLL